MALCYKDRSFCMAAPNCANAIGCFRHFDDIERRYADRWALRSGMVDEDGKPAPMVAYTDFSNSCPSYKKKG
jgi:hypothetical protein